MDRDEILMAVARLSKEDREKALKNLQIPNINMNPYLARVAEEHKQETLHNRKVICRPPEGLSTTI